MKHGSNLSDNFPQSRVSSQCKSTLVVIVPTMADYEALTRRLFFGNRNIRKFKTFVVMDRVKVGLSVPTDL